MSKDFEVIYLLDFYGDILTEKQREAIECYYNADLSLSEIASNLGITRQGVRDAVKRSETLLYDMEEKLGLVKKSLVEKEKLDKILNLTKKINDVNVRYARSKEIHEATIEIENTIQELYVSHGRVILLAFENLSDKLTSAFKKLKSKGKLSESDVKEAMREVRLALLEADVNYKVAKDFTKKVSERAIGKEVMESLTPAQMVIKIVNEELTELMGGAYDKIAFSSKPPTVIMLCGLQGSGKTTHAGKLALMLKNKGHRPLLVACDIYRPAAIDQLKVVGSKAGVPVFEMGKTDPVKISKSAIAHAKDYGNDIVILDTAGRLHVDEE